MINIINNDQEVTVKEIDELLSKVEANDEDLFYTSIRTSKKEQKAIKHSHFITAREYCVKCAGRGFSIRYPRPLYYTKRKCPTCKGNGSKLIGLVRVIGDSTYEYYITEVMVHPKYQGKGIGTKLMNTALDYCKQNGFMKVFLTAAPGREKYYRRFGFKKTKYTVMRILPKELK